MLRLLKSEGDLLPTLAIAFASVLWGVYWIPVRHLEGLGLEGVWPQIFLNVAFFVVALPIAIFRFKEVSDGGLRMMRDTFCVGLAITLYGNAFIFTDVVRAVLLFYLSPVWATIIGMIWLGEKLNLQRVGAIVLAFAGLFVILGFEDGVPLPHNIGDWMGLISGITWAIGSALVFSSKDKGALATTFHFAFMAMVSGFLMLLLFSSALIGAPPTRAVAEATLLPTLLTAGLLVSPLMFLTLWGAQRLSPGRVGILLMGEIVVGVSTAAILTGEPFGLREITGAVLVISAGLLEVWPVRLGPKKGVA